MDPAVTGRLAEGQAAASPGMKYKHYSPKAEVTLVARQRRGVPGVCQRPARGGHLRDGLLRRGGGACKALLRVRGGGGNHLTQARELFLLLRQLDDLGARAVYVRTPATDGVGLAVYNRLIRAAAFHFVELGGPGGEGGYQ